MLLTKHENETFQNDTVYLSGQAFINCRFVACTLVLRETVCHLDGCGFDRCNWHIDRVLLWGNPDTVREMKAIIGLIEQLQQQQLAQAPAGSTEGGPPADTSGGSPQA